MNKVCLLLAVYIHNHSVAEYCKVPEDQTGSDADMGKEGAAWVEEHLLLQVVPRRWYLVWFCSPAHAYECGGEGRAESNWPRSMRLILPLSQQG